MNENDLKAIEERAAKATPGPWKALPEPLAPDDQGPPERCDDIVGPDGITRIVKTDSGIYPPDWPTAQFIAEARSDVPALVAEVRRMAASDFDRSTREHELEAEVRRLQAALKESRESDGRHHQGMELLRRGVPDHLAAAARAEAAEAEVQRLRAFLEAHAFDFSLTDPYGRAEDDGCLGCQSEKGQPHAPDCELVALLGHIPKPKE